MPPDRYDFFDTFMLRFTQPEALNDPYECAPVFKGNVLNYFRTKAGDPLKGLSQKQAYDTFYGSFMGEMNKHYGILSLSKLNNNCVMWAHYTDNHKGFVLGFDENHSFFNRAKKVKYVKERYTINMGNISFDENLFLYKDRSWSYEKEVRVISDLDKSNRTLSGNIKLFSVPPELIRAVYFGVEFDRFIRQRVIKKIKNSDNLNHISTYEAELSDTEFIMEMEPIT